MPWTVLAKLTVVALAALGPIRERRDPRPRSTARHAGRFRRLVGFLRGRRSGKSDPFEVLRVQTRLGVVADEVRALERDQSVFAKAHHLEVTQTAYDALLAEACQLAGVPTGPPSHGDELERFREEVELASRGWSW